MKNGNVSISRKAKIIFYQTCNIKQLFVPNKSFVLLVPVFKVVILLINSILTFLFGFSSLLRLFPLLLDDRQPREVRPCLLRLALSVQFLVVGLRLLPLYLLPLSPGQLRLVLEVRGIQGGQFLIFLLYPIWIFYFY